MVQLTRFTIEKLDPTLQHITVYFEFTNPEWNIRDTIFYGFSSHDEYEEVTVKEKGKMVKKQRKILVVHPLLDVSDAVDVKHKLQKWAQAYIEGKQKVLNQEIESRPSDQVNKLVGKPITVGTK